MATRKQLETIRADVNFAAADLMGKKDIALTINTLHAIMFKLDILIKVQKDD